MFADHGAGGQAETLLRCAEDLTAELRELLHEELTIADAADESGYSEDHLRRLVREGTLPNAGENGAPRIRRRNLPRKPDARAGGDDAVHELLEVVRD